MLNHPTQLPSHPVIIPLDNHSTRYSSTCNRVTLVGVNPKCPRNELQLEGRGSSRSARSIIVPAFYAQGQQRDRARGLGRLAGRAATRRILEADMVTTHRLLRRVEFEFAVVLRSPSSSLAPSGVRRGGYRFLPRSVVYLNTLEASK